MTVSDYVFSLTGEVQKIIITTIKMSVGGKSVCLLLNGFEFSADIRGYFESKCKCILEKSIPLRFE